ncbi:MAG: SpoIIE family protein phosphatase [Vicingaceae bacterium]|jgi:PAS domain S-box-containing protein|nr:SpoIIE family protein phosphatase [Flavobacteriales bacterium]MDF1674161.1 SpoIIE family protein phosphatase [Vicingaceae bacterium]
MSLITDTILEQLNSLIVVVNQSGSVEYVSPSAKRILGFEPTQLLGEGWWNLTRDDAEERLSIKSLALKQLQQESLIETIPYERLLKTATGGDCWVLWNISKSNDNKLVGIGHNITDRKKAEQELLEKNVELLQHNKDMLDSIQYASRIQEAILPDVQRIKNTFQDAFVLYQPKDVVSGDYYFFYQKENKAFVVAVDCTGHGVPGALMSFIANGILKEVIIKKGLEDPAEILYALDEELFLALNKNSQNAVTNDGMDVSIGVYDFAEQTFSYSGAFRPLLLVRDGNIIELEANRYPIGFYADVKKKFVTQSITMQQNDTFYYFTDGYCDQFGGERKKKFNRKQFKELLLAAQTMEMEEQEAYLQYVLLNWRQDEPQVDDILVMGIKV